MARIASTTSAGVPVGPVGGMTLDALMARAKAAAERQGVIAAPRQIGSPWQGAAQMAQAFVNARQGAYAEDQATQGRQQLAQLLSGVNPETGADPATSAQIYSLDPAAGRDVMQAAAEAIRAKRLREQTLADRAEGRTYQEGQTASTRAYEQTDQIADEKRQAAAALAAATGTEGRAQVGQIADEARATAAANAEHERTLTEGKVKHITGEEAKAMGLDPTRIYEVGTSGAAKDITHDAPDTYREPTAEERIKYGLVEGQPYKMKVSGDGSVEPMSIGSGMQPIPAEVGAKLGLADLFLSNFEDIKASAAKGDATGLIDQPMATIFGRGAGGETYRQIRQGTEGLVRLMTGAGMPQSEAEDRARQYEPKITDDAPTLVSKLDGLKAAIESVRGGATFGRKAPPAPGTDTPAPEQYTPGQSYTFDDGSAGTYLGGDASDPSSWKITKQGGGG